MWYFSLWLLKSLNSFPNERIDFFFDGSQPATVNVKNSQLRTGSGRISVVAESVFYGIYLFHLKYLWKLVFVCSANNIYWKLRCDNKKFLWQVSAYCSSNNVGTDGMPLLHTEFVYFLVMYSLLPVIRWKSEPAGVAVFV